MQSPLLFTKKIILAFEGLVRRLLLTESTLAFPNLGGEHSSSGGNGPESMDKKCVADRGVYASGTGEGAVRVVWGSMVCTA